jgi:glyoxylase-like metal-dependent hydrolase (beta-lactamase superfamily II)
VDVFAALLLSADAHGLADVALSGVLLTHLHMGHYLGLMQCGREAMDWKGLQVCTAFCLAEFFAKDSVKDCSHHHVVAALYT